MKKFNTHSWAFKDSNNEFWKTGETKVMLMDTRKEAREHNKMWFCGRLKIVKVEVTVKEAA